MLSVIYLIITVVSFFFHSSWEVLCLMIAIWLFIKIISYASRGGFSPSKSSSYGSSVDFITFDFGGGDSDGGSGDGGSSCGSSCGGGCGGD